MLICVECGTRIHQDLSHDGKVECHACGIELELIDNPHLCFQLSPSEE